MTKTNSVVTKNNEALEKFIKNRNFAKDAVLSALVKGETKVELLVFTNRIGKHLKDNYGVRLIPTYEEVIHTSVKTGEAYTKWVYEIVREG